MEVKINIPQSLNEVTLGQYQEYYAIQIKSQDEKYLSKKMLEIFCGINATLVNQIKATDVNMLLKDMSIMFNETQPFINRFTMNGKEYGFIPVLNEMSFGEYVDIDTYLGDVENLHIAMNALYRPIAHKVKDRYNLIDYNGDNPEIMKDMPVSIALGAMVFFYRLGVELSTRILNSLDKEEETRLVQHLNLGKDGVGINLYTDLLREMLGDLPI